MKMATIVPRTSLLSFDFSLEMGEHPAFAQQNETLIAAGHRQSSLSIPNADAPLTGSVNNSRALTD